MPYANSGGVRINERVRLSKAEVLGHNGSRDRMHRTYGEGDASETHFGLGPAARKARVTWPARSAKLGPTRERGRATLRALRAVMTVALIGGRRRADPIWMITSILTW